jgi:hypothetical protein
MSFDRSTIIAPKKTADVMSAQNTAERTTSRKYRRAKPAHARAQPSEEDEGATAGSGTASPRGSSTPSSEAASTFTVRRSRCSSTVVRNRFTASARRSAAAPDQSARFAPNSERSGTRSRFCSAGVQYRVTIPNARKPKGSTMPAIVLCSTSWTTVVATRYPSTSTTAPT